MQDFVETKCKIQDFMWEKEETPRTMYTRLARFAKKYEGFFRGEPVGDGFFWSKIDKRIIDLILLKIIMDFHWRATLAKIFAVVKQCDGALCQNDATDLVSLLMDSRKSRETLVAAAGLIEAQVDKTLCCWSYGQASHA